MSRGVEGAAGSTHGHLGHRGTPGSAAKDCAAYLLLQNKLSVNKAA